MVRNVVRDKNGEVVQQTFVCSRAGLRQDRGLTTETRKHESRNEARCECGAMCHVHIDNANQDGGYHKVGYLKKDVHNQLARQRREHASDVSGALKYLAYLMSKDPLMFVSYTVNDDNTIGCNICFGNHHIQLTITLTEPMVNAAAPVIIPDHVVHYVLADEPPKNGGHIARFYL
ncbi:hypothetical protein HKD37_08G022303 [Glycine soja]